eukprot:TRINITY_DN11987_c0_g1_i1.p1 TRINITY_DN11987_c0_g1~~TRINITY_DN11987_c0_g1_i1.p1  ORF type:complete len:551 (-),score=101.37 TRINITY_DN11987_c0_g1_i1:116-1768(-)
MTSEGEPKEAWSGHLQLPKNSAPRVISKVSVESSASRHSNRKAMPTPEKVTFKIASQNVVSQAHESSAAFRWIRFFAQIVALGLMVVIVCMAIFNVPKNLFDDVKPHNQILAVVFLIGIALVALEEVIGLDKTPVMLMLSGVMWTFHAVSFHPISSEHGHEHFNEALHKALAEVSEVVLFLLPAMGIVESIDHYDGFSLVTAFITRRTRDNPGLLMPMICVITFFLSAIVDNLTSTIIAVKILRSLLPDQKEWRHACGGLAVVAANAGGAFSPVGDVTTTMLWVQGKVSTTSTVAWLFFPAVAAGIAPMAGIWWQAKHCARTPTDTKVVGVESGELNDIEVTIKSKVFLIVGLSSILTVPIMKIITGLPPYLGMIMAFGVFWLFANACVKYLGETSETDDHGEGVMDALHKVDLSSLLFFTGVLLAVSCLDNSGVLHAYAEALAEITGNNTMLLCTLLGVSSAVVDNVPLVQASINMFHDPIDAPLWQLVALAAGTGGSLLLVGSVAGVTFMGLEGVNFLWYCKNISHWAALGLALGLGTYQLELVAFGG